MFFPPGLAQSKMPLYLCTALEEKQPSKILGEKNEKIIWIIEKRFLPLRSLLKRSIFENQIQSI
jgi:hypothetical protein